MKKYLSVILVLIISVLIIFGLTKITNRKVDISNNRYEQFTTEQVIETTVEDVESTIDKTQEIIEKPTSEEIDNPIYNKEQIEKTEVAGIYYESDLFNFIDVNKFENALAKYNSVTIKNYDGGLMGVFNVNLIADGVEYDGVWVDSSGLWYESVDDYESRNN